MSDKNTSGTGGGKLAAFAIGAMAGTGIALLYAPRSGRETRKLLVKRGQDLSKQASNACNGAVEAVSGKKAQFVAAIKAGRKALQQPRTRHSKS